MKTLNRIDVFSVDVAIWSGLKRLRPEDLNLGRGGSLPPEDVANLGSKKIIDPEDLAVFYKLKKKMERYLNSRGIRFIGGYAIPREKTAETSAELDRLVQEFRLEKANFLARYDRAVDEWISKHPTYQDLIRNAVEPAAHVEGRIRADYTAFRIEPADEGGSLDREVARLGDRLLDEIAMEAEELYRDSIQGKSKISRRILQPLRRIREKLDGLAFLDGAISPLVAEIDATIAAFPSDGGAEGDLYHRVAKVVLIMGDPDKIRSLGTPITTMPVTDDGDEADVDEGVAPTTLGTESEKAPEKAPTSVDDGMGLFDDLFGGTDDRDERSETPVITDEPRVDHVDDPEPEETDETAISDRTPDMSMAAISSGAMVTSGSFYF